MIVFALLGIEVFQVLVGLEVGVIDAAFSALRLTWILVWSWVWEGRGSGWGVVVKWLDVVEKWSLGAEVVLLDLVAIDVSLMSF